LNRTTKFYIPYCNERGKKLIKRRAVGKVHDSERGDKRRSCKMTEVWPRPGVFA